MLFKDFKQKQFTLLWRGSRDWHPNTPTVILDTKGHIFGGFTHVE
jgi:hypothetical protein